MARLTQGILGGVLGKVGNVVGSSWKGIPVIKAMPLSVANPRTAGQLLQRGKMSNIVAYSLPFLASIIKPLNDRFAQRASGWNDFVRRNIHLFEDKRPDPISDLIISTGKMIAPTVSVTAGGDGPGSFIVTASVSGVDPFGLPTDKIYILAVNRETLEVRTANTATRAQPSDGTILLSGFATPGDDVDFYVAFRRVDGTVVSNTGYGTISL